MELSQENASHS